jgi:hypothetical protein
LYDNSGNNESDPAERFTLHFPNNTEKFSFRDHYQEYCISSINISLKFKKCIEKNRLTCLLYLWVRDMENIGHKGVIVL